MPEFFDETVEFEPLCLESAPGSLPLGTKTCDFKDCYYETRTSPLGFKVGIGECLREKVSTDETSADKEVPLMSVTTPASRLADAVRYFLEKTSSH